MCQSYHYRNINRLVVGDYLFDLLCAKAAGAIPVLLANHRKAEQFAQYADFVIENISDVVKIIEGK